MAFRLLLALCLAAPAWAAEVAGVKIDDKARVADTELSLSGAGLRKRVIFQVYAIGLYVRDPKADLISQPGPKRVLIHMLRDVGADQFVGALSEGIKENHSEAQAKALEPRVKELGATMASIQEAKKGMSIALDWTGSATQLSIDGKPTGRPIEGEDFYRAFDGPADRRRGLLPRPASDLARRQAGAGRPQESAARRLTAAQNGALRPGDTGLGARGPQAPGERHCHARWHALRHPRRDPDSHVRSRPQNPVRPRRPRGNPYRAQCAQGEAGPGKSRGLRAALRRHHHERPHGAL